MTAKHDINLKARETYGMVVRLTEANGWASLSGADVLAQIRRQNADGTHGEVLLTFTAVVDPETGEIDLSLPADASAALFKYPNLYWDLRIDWPDGNVRYPIGGKVHVAPAISVPA